MTPSHHTEAVEDSFEAKVLVALEGLQKDMKSIIGNGQPGRLQIVEASVSDHGKTINRMVGGLVLLSSGAVIAVIGLIVKVIR